MNLSCIIAFAGQHSTGLKMIDAALRLEPRIAPAMRVVPFYVKSFMREGAEADFGNLSILCVTSIGPWLPA
jgi:hypothetical protein